MVFRAWGSSLKIVLSAGLFLLTIGWSWPAQAAFEEAYSLDNGLKVILSPQPGNPIMTVQVVIKAGAGSEVERPQFGLAHFIEHLAFNSTAKMKNGPGHAYARADSVGGTLSADTSWDLTRYHMTLPADAGETALDILSEMVFHPAHLPDELALEKEVVLEEINRSLDIVDHQLQDDCLALIFGEHPYGHSIGGYEDTVRGFDQALVRDFFQRHYRPDNAILIITGGFETELIKLAVTRYFQSLPQAEDALPDPGTRALNPVGGPRIKVATNPAAPLAKVGIAFRGMDAADSRLIASYFLVNLLHYNGSGRFDKKIKNQLKLVNSIGGLIGVMKGAGIIIFTLETETDKVEAAAAAVLDELAALSSSSPLMDDEVERIRNKSASDFAAEWDGSRDLADLLGRAEGAMGDWRLRDVWQAQLKRVKPDDLMELAGQLFVPENMAVSVVLPAKDAGSLPMLETAIAARIKSFAPAPHRYEKKIQPKAFVEMEPLPGGIRLLLRQDADESRVRLWAGWPGGALTDEPGREGLGDLMAAVWAKSALHDTFERLGAKRRISSDDNTFEFAGTFLSSNWEEALTLWVEMMIRPDFGPGNLAVVRRDKLTNMKHRDERASNQVANLANSLIFGDDNRYAHDRLGNPETLAAFTSEDLKALHRRAIRPENMIIVAIGNVEPQALRTALARALTDWKPGGAGWKKSAPAAPVPILERRVATREMNRAQAHLRWAFLAPGYGHPDRAAIEMLNLYLGSPSGPLYTELGDRQGLAYTLQASYWPYVGSGQFCFYVAADPSKTARVIVGLEKIAAEVRNRDLSPEEVEKVRRLALGRRKMALETNSKQARRVLIDILLHQDSGFEAKYQMAMEAVTPADLRRVAEKYLDPDRSVLAVVGKKESLDLLKPIQEKPE